MFKFCSSRKKIIDIDERIRSLKDELRRAENEKYWAVHNHYKGIPGIFLRRRLRDLKQGKPVDVFS